MAKLRRASICADVIISDNAHNSLTQVQKNAHSFEPHGIFQCLETGMHNGDEASQSISLCGRDT